MRGERTQEAQELCPKVLRSRWARSWEYPGASEHSKVVVRPPPDSRPVPAVRPLHAGL